MGGTRRERRRLRGLDQAPAAGLVLLVVVNLVVLAQLVWSCVVLALVLAVLDLTVALRLTRPWWSSGVRL